MAADCGVAFEARIVTPRPIRAGQVRTGEIQDLTAMQRSTRVALVRRTGTCEVSFKIGPPCRRMVIAV